MKPPLQRLLKRITITREWCWEPDRYYHKRTGYTRVITPGGTAVQGHRITYEAFIGKIPEGLEIDHLCRNRRCVNPSHLEPVTRKENAQRSPLVGKRKVSQLYCPKGHLKAANMTEYKRANGKPHWVCKICHNENAKRYYHRKKGQTQ